MKNLILKPNTYLLFYQLPSFQRKFFLKKKQKYFYKLSRFYLRLFFETNNLFLVKSFFIFFSNIFMRCGKKAYILSIARQFLIFFKQFQRCDPMEFFYIWSFYYAIPAQLLRYKLGQYRKAKVIEFLRQHAGSGRISSWFHLIKQHLIFGQKSILVLFCYNFLNSLYFLNNSEFAQTRQFYLNRLVFGINYLYNSRFLGYKVNRLAPNQRNQGKYTAFIFKRRLKPYTSRVLQALLLVNLFKYLFYGLKKKKSIYYFKVIKVKK